MEIGYARVSTGEQTLNLQLDALASRCGRVFEETASGAKAERTVLKETLAYARPGDTLVVWRLDRLGRSLEHLIETVTELERRGIGFKSLTEQIDTTTSGGKLIFHILGHWRSSSGILFGRGRMQGLRRPGRGASLGVGHRHCLRKRSSWPEDCMRIRARLLLRHAKCWGYHAIHCGGM
jgi:hypothetical protein